jgi:hypothetical protein
MGAAGYAPGMVQPNGGGGVVGGGGPPTGAASAAGGGGGGNALGAEGKAPSNTLRMRGLPFRATADEISRFFGDFQILPGGITIGQREGRPSGEAWVTFASPAESTLAMQMMNKKHMGRRYVELFEV